MNPRLHHTFERLLVLVCLLSQYTSGATGQTRFTREAGAIVRGDISKSEVALVFTGDEFGEGTRHIRTVLDSLDVKASFFLTGRFYRNPKFADEIMELVADGHYLGAHSDKHLLYCSWDDRDSVLVSQEEFKRDVLDNYLEMTRFGVSKQDALYFLPAYEWYNDRISEWTRQLGLQLVNYSPGTRSHADYTTPEMGEAYRTSDEIMESILSFESESPEGLNGFVLLSHVGSAPERTDKFYFHLDTLISSLRDRGYDFVRVDELFQD